MAAGVKGVSAVGQPTAGYSGTPLPRKLGLKQDFKIALVNAPETLPKALGPLPAGATIVGRGRAGLDLVMLFVRRQAELRRAFPRWAERLSSAGMIWVAWPKKAAKVATDLSFDGVQKVGLEAGLVDTKICAIDATWSGLRFVRRLKDRPTR